MKQSTPTYGAFNNAILEDFKKDHTYLSNKECEGYIFSTESPDIINNNYSGYVEKYENDVITYENFMRDGVVAVSNCLDLLYE